MANQFTTVFDQLVVAAVAAGMPSPQVRLYTNTNAALDSQTRVADLTEPTYAGYAPLPISWDTVWRDDDGSVTVQGPLCQFQQLSTVTPVTAYGYFVTYTAAGSGANAGVQLAWAEPFDQPEPLATALDAIIVSPSFSFGAPGNSNGSATVL